MSETTQQPVDNDNINLEEVQRSGRPFLKGGTYILRCIGCEKQKSKKQNDMLVFEWEICSPKEITVTVNNAEKTITIAGMKLTDWIVFNDMGLSKFKDLHKSCELPMVLSKKNPNTKQYLGKAVKAYVITEPKPIKDEVTGEPLIDDSTGEVILTNNYVAKRFTGSASDFTLPSDSVAF